MHCYFYRNVCLWKCSGITHGSTLRNYSWWCLGYHIKTTWDFQIRVCSVQGKCSTRSNLTSTTEIFLNLKTLPYPANMLVIEAVPLFITEWFYTGIIMATSSTPWMNHNGEELIDQGILKGKKLKQFRENQKPYLHSSYSLLIYTVKHICCSIFMSR